MTAASIRGLQQVRPALPPHIAAHEAFYRQQGWWPGERLLDRYLRLSRQRLDALAVVDSRGRELTHRQLLAAADDAAAAIAGAGLGPGDVGLMALPNCVEW